MDSILTSIKKLLGIVEEDTSFDRDLIMHINSVFMILQQLGVGPDAGFSITDDSETWGEYLSSNDSIEAVKSYIYLKVRLLFDPPTSSSVMEACKQNIAELEWRLNVAVDPK